MSIYDDDGFDEEAAELASAISSTGSYTTPGGGTATGFSFDDGGDSGITVGKSNPYGGTEIQGNVIKGGTIFGRTQSQLDRQQRLAGMGDYQNSQQYKDYLKDTGRSLQNPYGNTGLFSGIFGADRVNYNMDPAQAQNILDIGFDRYMNFDQQPEYAQSRGFGKLFGSPEGEMTVEGELRAQVPEMTTAESLFRSVIPGASFFPNPGTTYVPMGTVDFQPNPGYDPERDPRANQDLRSGPFSLLTDALSKGRDFIASKLSPAEELAAQTQTQARGPELSQTVSGGRFEDESARPQVMTPDQEFLTFDGGIQDSLRQSQQGPQRTTTPEVKTAMDALQTKIDEAGLTGRQRDNFLNDVIAQREGSTTSLNKDLVLDYFPEDTESLAADYQIAASRLKEMEDFNAAPTYPQSQNFGKRSSDPLPATLSAGDFVLPSGEVINTNRSSFSGSILKDIIDGNLFETDFLGGQLKFSPEFDLKRGLTGGNIQFKKRF